MRALIQRVSQASVTINSNIHSEISDGLLVLLGIETSDNEQDANWLVQKITQMRIFSDEQGKINSNVKDANGELLIVSQFTLHASTKKGNRPSFINAARPEVAISLYNFFIDEARKHIPTKTGIFGADMQVGLVNNGPVTILLDSRNKE
jgi:D-tyrosyl-tRNA(Tyr) deacylase